MDTKITDTDQQKVSIIIPVYNGQKYIRQCLRSALTQRYKNYEIIVIDDGSTDNTARILNEFPLDEHLTVVFHKENGGTASALNMGITLMSGNWFKWLSADDILKPNALEDMMKLINNLDPEYYDKYIFYTHYDRLNENDYSKGVFKEPDISDKPFIFQQATMLDHFYGNGSTSLIHKDVFKKVGLFDETLGFQEDYEFWLRAMLIYNIHMRLIPINTLQYRIHDQQLTETKAGSEAVKKSSEIRTKIFQQLDIENQVTLLRELKHVQKTKPLKAKLKNRLRKILYQ